MDQRDARIVDFIARAKQVFDPDDAGNALRDRWNLFASHCRFTLRSTLKDGFPRQDFAWTHHAIDWFVENFYERLRFVTPGWILALVHKEDCRWRLLPGCGLTASECREIEGDKRILIGVENCKWPVARDEGRTDEIGTIRTRRHANSWHGVPFARYVLWDEMECGVAILPTVAPLIFAAEDLFAAKDLPAKQSCRTGCENLASVFEQAADFILKRCDTLVAEARSFRPEIPPTIASSWWQLLRTTEHNQRPNSNAAGGSTLPSASPLTSEECVLDEIALPYRITLRKRLETLAVRLIEGRARRVIHPAAQTGHPLPSGDTAFDVAFLLKEEGVSGFRWFLTERQRKILDDNIPRALARRFSARIFHTDVFVTGDAKGGIRRYAEGMVGHMVMRGGGPVFFPRPIVPPEFERGRLRRQRLHFADRVIRNGLDGTPDFFDLAVDCAKVEERLWLTDRPTVELFAACSADVSLAGPESAAKRRVLWVDEKLDDAIVCVIQYETWADMATHFPDDMRLVRDVGRVAIAELVSGRDAWRAKTSADEHRARADLAASFSHAYVKEARAIGVCADAVARHIECEQWAEAKSMSAELKDRAEQYRTEMDVFAQFSKMAPEDMSGLVFQDASDEDEARTTVLALLGLGLCRALGVIGRTADDTYIAQLWPKGSASLVSTALKWAAKIRRYRSDAISLESDVFAEISGLLGRTLYIDRSVLVRLAGDLRVPVIPAGGRGDIRAVYVDMIEKMFFEIFFNALLNIVVPLETVSTDQPDSRPRSTVACRPEIVHGETGTSLTCRNFFCRPQDNALAGMPYLSDTEDKAMWQEPERPAEAGFVGWGLYGNHVFCQRLGNGATFSFRAWRSALARSGASASGTEQQIEGIFEVRWILPSSMLRTG